MLTQMGVDGLYLNLPKKCLARTIGKETCSAVDPWFSLMRLWFLPVRAFLWARGWNIEQIDWASAFWRRRT
jgi:hypothetical protein